MAYKDFLFLDERNTSEYSNILVNIDGSVLVLEVNGTSVNIQVEGKIDNKEENWTILGGIKQGSLTKTSTITSSGQYMIVCLGSQKIRIKDNSATKGEVKVFGGTI